jgi:uncharacterized protein (TIGR00299 family) protein
MPLKGIAHVHLDPLGGIAGDMFAAAVLDAFPELEAPLAEALAGSGAPAGHGLRRIPVDGHGLAGSRIEVQAPEAPSPSGHLTAVLDRLAASALAPAVRNRATAIYRLLAEAEGRIHGIPPEQVHFHELADWDSYLDIVAAAWLIEHLGARSWSVSALPLGRGRVRTAHGLLPVPAPATALLLRGLPVHDDGIAGERVTPTGAAILRHLAPATTVPPGIILATGHGFGTRLLEGVPNLLRLLAMGDQGATTDQVGVIRFEIDDQTGEDLAVALDHLRAMAPVRDVCQWPVLGKKGRLASAVQVLCDPGAVDAVATACLSETSTIGLRSRVESRRVLPREALEQAKRVHRPDGSTTVKADADALAGSYAARAARRREIEQG